MESIWIDAAEFDCRGGFILETQFVREMGQAYLMANSVGEAVEPASVTFHTLETGYHRVHIRTKNWLCEHNPDGLVVEVDGVRAEHVCANAHIRDWYFEIGGDFYLESGTHTLRIHDTKGWFARFACVIITNDYNFTPSAELRMLKRQRAEIKGIRDTVEEMGTFDLIVAGGGVGGVVAAITAARYGLKTALINDRPLLGGNAADEANVTLEGTAHRGYHETGVVFELKTYRQSHEATWSDTFARFTAREELLEVFSNTLLIDATAQNGRITDVLTVGTTDMQRRRFKASLFVDATGDGWLGYYAGARYRVGREAKFQHGESFAPDVADGCTMSGCATAVGERLQTICSYLAKKTDAPVAFHAPDWAFRLPQGDALGRTPVKLECGRWWLEMPNDYDDLFEGEFVRDSMLRMSLGYFDWLKNSWPDREMASNYRLLQLGTYNAKRESRRLIGDCILTENDFTEGRSFPDAVGYCGWKIDVHHPQGIFSGKQGEFTVNKEIPISPIPFSALYSQNVENLMMAGRCISVTHLGLGPVRVQLTIATMVQAVATAAYLCKKRGATPREVRINHIDELQQLLLKDGMTIPGVSHHDAADHARRAHISATSCVANGEPTNAANGRVWVNDGADYAWVSDRGLPQSITLTLDRPQTVRQVRITFDIPFSDYRYGYMEQPAATRMVCDFSLSALTDAGWQELQHISDNNQRLVVLDLPPTVASAVRITVNKTLGEAVAVIPEIRIYS